MAGGVGGSRGDIVTTAADFDLTSIGIEALIDDGASLTFNAYVWSSAGLVGQTPLAVGAAMVVTGDGTLKFYDLPVAFTLSPGREYDIGIDFGSYNAPALQIRYYTFSSLKPPFTVSPITVLDGEEGRSGPDNFLTPHLRLNAIEAIPEPGSLVLLGTGVLGLARAVRKRRG